MPESHRLELYQRKTLTQVFSSVFCEISKNTFCYRTLWWLPLTKRSSLDVWQGSEYASVNLICYPDGYIRVWLTRLLEIFYSQYQFANLCVFLDNYLKCDRINNGFTLFIAISGTEIKTLTDPFFWFQKKGFFRIWVYHFRLLKKNPMYWFLTKSMDSKFRIKQIMQCAASKTFRW